MHHEDIAKSNFWELVLIDNCLRTLKITSWMFLLKGNSLQITFEDKNGAHKVKTFLKSRQNKPLWLKWSLKTSQDESRWWKESLPSAWMNKNELKVHAWTKMNFMEKLGFHLEVEDRYSASKVRVDIACIKIHAWTKNELFEKN